MRHIRTEMLFLIVTLSDLLALGVGVWDAMHHTFAEGIPMGPLSAALQAPPAHAQGGVIGTPTPATTAGTLTATNAVSTTATSTATPTATTTATASRTDVTQAVDVPGRPTCYIVLTLGRGSSTSSLQISGMSNTVCALVGTATSAAAT